MLKKLFFLTVFLISLVSVSMMNAEPTLTELNGVEGVFIPIDEVGHFFTVHNFACDMENLLGTSMNSMTKTVSDTRIILNALLDETEVPNKLLLPLITMFQTVAYIDKDTHQNYLQKTDGVDISFLYIMNIHNLLQE